MWLGALGVVLTVSTVTHVAMERPTPVPRVYRDVVIMQGTVRGYLTSDPPYFAYFGIPYAHPPTRSDRFKSPQPPPEWDGIFEATHKIQCPQVKADGEENCLVINIFIPEEKEASLLPVVVLVHGGEFQNGWGAYRPPAAFLNEGNNVIVTFNYRLGSLGFLCLRTPDAPGNAGLKDQIAALYWIHRNIEPFGGNPQDVTVYGTEAGAVAVQLMLLSGLVEGLLHKVILESGSALSPYALTYEPLTVAYAGAASLGYQGSDDPDKLYQFYLDTPDKELVTISETFLPCVDNTTDNVHSLIDVDPMQKLEEGLFTNVPMILTYMQKDTASILGTNMKRFEKPPDHFEFLLPHNLEFKKKQIKSGVAEIVKKFYFPEDFTTSSMASSYAYYIHDILVEYPIIKVAMMFAAKNTYPVYVMKFSLPRTSQDSDELESSSVDTILDYLYKEDNQTAQFLEQITTLLRNFRMLGDPTPLSTELIPVIWQPVITDVPLVYISSVSVLHLAPTAPMKMSTHKNPRLEFWDKIYTRFHRSHNILLEELDLNSEEEDGDSDSTDSTLLKVKEK